MPLTTTSASDLNRIQHPEANAARAMAPPTKTPHNTRGRKRDENGLHLEAVGDKGRCVATS